MTTLKGQGRGWVGRITQGVDGSSMDREVLQLKHGQKGGKVVLKVKCQSQKFVYFSMQLYSFTAHCLL